MRCYIHPEAKAVGICAACGGSVCRRCAVTIRGRTYCRACAASIVSHRRPTTNSLAITSLVLGILSVPLMFAQGVGVIPGVLAVIFGLVARRQIRTGQGAQGGEELAIAGLITGGVVLGLAVIVVASLAAVGQATGDVFSDIVNNI